CKNCFSHLNEMKPESVGEPGLRDNRSRFSRLPVALALVPDVPAFYRNFTNIQLGLPTLFELNTEPGCQLREILRRMACEDIKGDIQACQTTPDLQLKQVVGATNPDLIVISKEPYNRLWRFLFGEIIRPLLRWIDRPVLVA
ncbi:MAG: universal stress protein, partial [Anaerolineales bacterium]